MRGQVTMRSEPSSIVVVHSDTTLRTQIAALLGDCEHWRVYQAVNGAETLQIALQTLPQLILLDPHLAGMDGFATIVALRAHGISCPVVALVSHDQRGDEFWAAQGFAAAVAVANDRADLDPQITACIKQFMQGGSSWLH